MEIRKSQLRDKLGWEVICGFNPLPMASDFPPCEKNIEKGLHKAFFLHLPPLHI